ncbi:hypothetical protein HK405_003777 [Cladochytrium tenue]|nr:hypothetical protein HK405_003777 [Cladochytrium tenue]
MSDDDYYGGGFGANLDNDDDDGWQRHTTPAALVELSSQFTGNTLLDPESLEDSQAVDDDRGGSDDEDDDDNDEGDDDEDGGDLSDGSRAEAAGDHGESLLRGRLAAPVLRAGGEAVEVEPTGPSRRLSQETRCFLCDEDHEVLRCPLADVCFACYRLGHQRRGGMPDI